MYEYLGTKNLCFKYVKTLLFIATYFLRMENNLATSLHIKNSKNVETSNSAFSLLQTSLRKIPILVTKQVASNSAMSFLFRVA